MVLSEQFHEKKIINLLHEIFRKMTDVSPEFFSNYQKICMAARKLRKNQQKIYSPGGFMMLTQEIVT